jgi:hypothetical protein
VPGVQAEDEMVVRGSVEQGTSRPARGAPGRRPGAGRAPLATAATSASVTVRSTVSGSQALGVAQTFIFTPPAGPSRAGKP